MRDPITAFIGLGAGTILSIQIGEAVAVNSGSTLSAGASWGLIAVCCSLGVWAAGKLFR